MRATDGFGELPVPSYEVFSEPEVLGRMALERMLAGLSTRRYPVALERWGRADTPNPSNLEPEIVSMLNTITLAAAGNLTADPRTPVDRDTGKPVAGMRMSSAPL